MTEWDSADLLVIDGHGDFETLSWYRADGDEIELTHATPFFPDKSVGGVFDTITQALGFGTHGQGSTMALAALGEPTEDFSDILSLREDGSLLLSEWTAMHRYASWRRTRDQPIEQRHRDLAASLQRALESTVRMFIEQRRTPGAPLAIAGGVGLSCRMNGYLRRTLGIEAMEVPPAANDAGTAIGAALLADRELTGRLPRINAEHSYWGPAWSDEGVHRELSRFKIPHTRVDDISATAAELLAEGQVICWFQGRMEFGPRALGGRSILADPRRAELKDRVNLMKGRQAWRPFGPSILAGHEGEWFEDPWDSRFMLFAVNVRDDKREEIPMVVHDDGSTRPQAVHADTNPRYHALISAFHRATGVPMVVNTSFNTGGEAIVMTPRQAVASFVRLGADYLAIGDSLVSRNALRR
jgi:carbamoyltransferase